VKELYTILLPDNLEGRYNLGDLDGRTIIKYKGKDKVIPVQAVEALRVERG
jgi:hypothetical protein